MGTRGRAAVLGVLGTGASGALTAWLLRAAVGQWPGRGSVPLDGAVGFLSTAAAAGVATWVTVVVAVATLPLLGASSPVRPLDGDLADTRVTGRVVMTRPAARVTAALLAAAALGTGATTAHAGPVIADGAQVRTHEPSATDGSSSDSTVRSTTPTRTPTLPEGSAVPVPGWTPTPEPASSSRPAQGTAAPSATLVTTGGDGTGRTAVEGRVVVHRGDSLWSIAAQHLGEQATDADVADAWPRWYAANRELIGEDPDHLLPGQVLVVPTGADR